jgi:glycosyltransferase involved in cell wall biosynthesis
MKVIITSPSLKPNKNISGISSVTKFITQFNDSVQYIHFELGKADKDRRDLAWFLRIIKSYLKWAALLIRTPNSVIHFNLAVDRFGLLRDSPLIFFSMLLRKRVIVHLHGGEFMLHHHVPKWMTFLLNLIFFGRTIPIVLSPGEADLLKGKYKCKKVFVLPNCIDLTQAKLFDRTFNESEIPIILFMGRISLNKGIENIFEALKLLKSQGHRFKFHLAGKGPEEEVFVTLFRDLLGSDFSFEGVVTGDAKIRLLKACNTFLLPSFFEGLPIALLESMSFGLVPITTSVGSIKYLVKNGDNGFIVSQKSPSEIASAIKELAKNYQYMQQLSKNAKQSIFHEHDPGKYLNYLNNIYKYE